MAKWEIDFEEKVGRLMRKIADSEADRYKGLHGESKTLDSDFLELLKKSHLTLHEKKIGKYQIKIEVIPAFKELTVVSTRNWLMMGYRPMKVKYDCPRIIFKLFKENSLLVSDSPFNQRRIRAEVLE